MGTARRKAKCSLPPAVLARAEERAKQLGGSLSTYIEALMLFDQERPILQLGPVVATLDAKAAVKRSDGGRATIASARAARTKTRGA